MHTPTKRIQKQHENIQRSKKAKKNKNSVDLVYFSVSLFIFSCLRSSKTEKHAAKKKISFSTHLVNHLVCDARQSEDEIIIKMRLQFNSTLTFDRQNTNTSNDNNDMRTLCYTFHEYQQQNMWNQLDCVVEAALTQLHSVRKVIINIMVWCYWNVANCTFAIHTVLNISTHCGTV